MKIPKYWAKGTAEDTDSRGNKVAFSCWRWSDESEEHAQETALTAAQKIVQNWMRGAELGRYEYGAVPLREEVIERICDAQDELVGVVTRNAYGSLVLNTSRVMFVDIDFPQVTLAEGLKYFFARLFGRSMAPPESQREQQTQDTLRRFLEERPDWAARVYRTLAGLRVLVTHELFDPQSDQTLKLLQQLGCDPLYMRLCRSQECFRARLTPKPWRCGHSVNTFKYPFEDDERAQQFARWNAEYAARQKGYATCRYLGTLGKGGVQPQAERVIELHDYATRCNEPLPLA